MKILRQGAEAVIYSETLDGKKILIKERVKKRYRLSQIDERLRSARTRQEMKLMREARGNGVLTPRIVSSDEKSHKIVMEDLNGELVKNFLEKNRATKRVCNEIGRNVGKLHSSGIIHGDLTTSNMILKNGELYLIDFGLGQFSNRIEDMATDMNVLAENLRATHAKVSGRCWKNVVDGYRSENKRAGNVLRQVEEVRGRARYRERRSQI